MQRDFERMKRSSLRIVIPALLVAASAACVHATARTGIQPDTGHAARLPTAATNDRAQPAHVEADVRFMAGMVPHHAQAVLIAGWAASHGARADIRILSERIVVSQRDEIELMRNWLRDRNETVPDANSTRMKMRMDGVKHDMLMPGMLTADEMAQLDRARGPEFDRLFLTFMIRHHQGALSVVEQLFGSYGAAQDETVFRLASDVFADQSTEIDRMQRMLAALPPDRSSP